MLRKKINELLIEVVGGQIMSRVTANEKAGDPIIEKRKVVVPKSICSDGSINVGDMAEENLKVPADEKKLTREGDIVIKLSTPYDAALITSETAGSIVPSFCAVIRNNSEMDSNYLLAFLNSSYCKEQLKMQVAGAVMTILSVGKIKNVEVPILQPWEQEEIGKGFIESQKKIAIVRRILELEEKKNDAIFAEMVRNND